MTKIKERLVNAASSFFNINKYLLIICLAVVFGISVPVGFGFGIIGALGDHVQAWSNHTLEDRFSKNLTRGELETLWAAVVSIFLIGGAFGSLGGAWISDQLGRKASLLVCYSLYLTGSICFLACRLTNFVELLLLGRLISGFAAGLSTSTAPMYLSEIAPLKLRGPIAVLFSFGLTLGIIIGGVCSLEEVLGSSDTWHYGLSVYGVLVIFALIPYPFFPESPKYLYSIAKQKQKSIDALTLLRGSNLELIEEELRLMEKESNIESNSRSMMSVLKDPLLRLPLILTCFIQIGQQLSGITAVAYYTVPLYQAAGLTPVQAKWGNLGLGLLNFILACPSPFIMGKLNRRPVLITSCFSCAVSLTFMAIGVFYLAEAFWSKIMAICATFGFVASFQIGLASIPYFIGAELFEVPTRPAAMAIGSIASWTFNFASAMSYPSIQLAIGAFVFLPYLFVVVSLGIFLIFYLPETRNCNPCDIAPKLSRGFKSKPLQ